jgi:hypothetical protein
MLGLQKKLLGAPAVAGRWSQRPRSAATHAAAWVPGLALAARSCGHRLDEGVVFASAELGVSVEGLGDTRTHAMGLATREPDLMRRQSR